MDNILSQLAQLGITGETLEGAVNETRARAKYCAEENPPSSEHCRKCPDLCSTGIELHPELEKIIINREKE
jgi:hypothetical protein